MLNTYHMQKQSSESFRRFLTIDKFCIKALSSRIWNIPYPTPILLMIHVLLVMLLVLCLGYVATNHIE